MEKKYIGIGVLSGLAAGIASFGYARVEISPLIEAAIDYEDTRTHAVGEHSHAHEVFSRSLQENVGAAVGSLVFGVVMGALFAVAWTVVVATLRRRGIAADPRAVAVGVVVTAFVSTNAIPALAYPPNPPGVGLEETIGERTSTYLAVVVISVALAATAAAVAFRATPRVGGWTAATSAVVGYAAAIGVVVALLPSFDEVPGAVVNAAGDMVLSGFPAAVLSEFRAAALVNQALLWAVLGGCFVVLLPRILGTAFTRQMEVLHGDR